MAKLLGYRVIANDWEPYAQAINRCYIACNRPPEFASLGGYEQAIERLNRLPPKVGWVTEHLCPRDDDRLRHPRATACSTCARTACGSTRFASKSPPGKTPADSPTLEEACLLAPLVYQACYRSNTSGVFKGFHNGWGGQTQTALYRIATDLRLDVPVFRDNGQENLVFREDAQTLAERLASEEVDDRVSRSALQSASLRQQLSRAQQRRAVGQAALSKQITRGTKAAIRLDWRTERRSAYNYREEASAAYRRLLDAINARYILTSYSTDGTIPLGRPCCRATSPEGTSRVVMQGYKRYRVSSQRFSKKPMNVEFVLVLDTHRKSKTSADELRAIDRRARNHGA